MKKKQDFPAVDDDPYAWWCGIPQSLGNGSDTGSILL